MPSLLSKQQPNGCNSQPALPTGCAVVRASSAPNRFPICHNLWMCGRYRLSRRKQILEEHFDTAPWDDDWSPRYNIAPTQPIPVIRQNPKEPVRQISTMRWGLIPHWAKEASGAARMINARSETAHTLAAFRDALKSRRCLIPADGFYEWAKTPKGKQPYCFQVGNGELLAFAGLWERWRDPSGNWVKTCSILTTTPNAVTSVVHDRMPVILHPDAYDLWLDLPTESRRRWRSRSREPAPRCRTAIACEPPKSRRRSATRASCPRPPRQSSTFALYSP
jgi:putative SOS response-associated peptidase YedK